MLTNLPPNCQRTNDIEVARARLSNYVELQALYITRISGVSYEETEDAPEKFADVVAAWYKAKARMIPFPVYKGASENTVYITPSANWAFRFWHDFLHITHGKGMTFHDEEFIAHVHVAMVEQEFGKLSLEAKLMKADTLGQAIYYRLWGKHVQNQLDFVLYVLDDETFYTLADYRKPGANELQKLEA